MRLAVVMWQMTGEARFRHSFAVTSSSWQYCHNRMSSSLGQKSVSGPIVLARISYIEIKIQSFLAMRCIGKINVWWIPIPVKVCSRCLHVYTYILRKYHMNWEFYPSFEAVGTVCVTFTVNRLVQAYWQRTRCIPNVSHRKYVNFIRKKSCVCLLWKHQTQKICECLFCCSIAHETD